MGTGYFIPVIHAHFPFYTADDNCERAFADYVFSSLLPFLRCLDRLESDNVTYGMGVSFSPSLLALLARGETVQALRDNLRQIADEYNPSELAKSSPEFTRYNCLLDLYYWFNDRFKSDLPAALQNIASYGNVELIATTATNAPLPLFSACPSALHGQIGSGCDYFSRTFGLAPSCLWLEHAPYFLGMNDLLKKYGIRAFFCSAKSISHASSAVKYGANRPVWAGEGVAGFAVNPEFTAQISAGNKGYYLDSDYFCSEKDFAQQYAAAVGSEKNRGAQKYNPEAARNKADLHAGHYLSELQKNTGAGECCVVALDISWFGQKWREGAVFFDLLLRKMCFDQEQIRAVTPSAYLELEPEQQSVAPGESSLLCGETFSDYYKSGYDELLPELQLAAERLQRVSGDERVTAQMATELLLAQEDNLIVTANPDTQTDRNRKRLSRFCSLEEMLKSGVTNEQSLQALQDDSFPIGKPSAFTV